MSTNTDPQIARLVAAATGTTDPTGRLTDEQADALFGAIIAIADLFADEGDYETGLKVAKLADRVAGREVAA